VYAFKNKELLLREVDYFFQELTSFTSSTTSFTSLTITPFTTVPIIPFTTASTSLTNASSITASIPFTTPFTTFSTTATSIISHISTGPIEFAKAGDIFLIQKTNGYEFADIKTDTYGSWGKTSGLKGSKEFPHIKVFYATHPNSTTEKFFKKRIYQTVKEDHTYYLVHYFGDEEIYIPKPHGNAKKQDNQPYQKTMPKVRKEIIDLVDKNTTANQAMKQISNTMGDNFDKLNHSSEIPKGIKQIENIRYYYEHFKDNNSSDKILEKIVALENSKDIIFTLYCYLPDTTIGMWNPLAVELLERATLMKSLHTTTTPQYGLNFIHYSLDTTFNVGPYYLTLIGFKNLFIEEEPLIVCGAYTHVQKNQISYELIAANMFSTFPQLYKAKIAVTDGDEALINAFLPKFTSKGSWMPCFNHKTQNLIQKCKELKLDSNYYRELIYGTHLQACNGYVDLDEDEFIKKIDKAEDIWDKDFYQWFMENQYNDILKYMLPSSRKRNGLDITSKTKLTTNSSEAINNMIKQATQHRWLSEDKLIDEMKNFFHLQNMKWISCCLSTSSDWHLKSEWNTKFKINSNTLFSTNTNIMDFVLTSLSVNMNLQKLPTIDSIDLTSETENITNINLSSTTSSTSSTFNSTATFSGISSLDRTILEFKEPIQIQFVKKHITTEIMTKLIKCGFPDAIAKAMLNRAINKSNKEDGVVKMNNGGDFLVISDSHPGTYFPVSLTSIHPSCENPHCKQHKHKAVCAHILAVFLSNRYSLENLYLRIKEKLIKHPITRKRKKNQQDTTLAKGIVNPGQTGKSGGQKDGVIRKSYNSRPSIDRPLNEQIILNDNEEINSKQINGEIISETSDSSDEYSELSQNIDSYEVLSEEESLSQTFSKRLRSNLHISKDQNFNNIDSLPSSSSSSSSSFFSSSISGEEHTIEYFPKGARSGPLPSCYACKKLIQRNKSRVVWWKKYSRTIPGGSKMVGSINKVPLCSNTPCILTPIKYGLETIQYNGESLLCQSQLSSDEKLEYEALKEELELQID
jgi:hypothetical protein